jgi:RNA polymerase sigma-70 factor (ECF subfamily)
MYYFEGYSQSEIATEIGKSLRTTQLYLAECLQLCYEAKNNLLELGLDER